MAVQVPELLLAATAAPPPNCVKFTVTPEMVSELLSPPAVLFQVAVTVSPILNAPPVPLAPEIESLASLTVTATLSTVALVESAAVADWPLLSVAMTDTYIERILRARVYDVAIESPLEAAPRLSRRIGNTVLLKREDMQPVFSFKLRGAYNKIAHLAESAAQRGVICASAGNHAQGVALAARKRGE